MVLGLKTNVKMGHNSLRLFSDGYRNICLFFIVAIFTFQIAFIGLATGFMLMPFMHSYGWAHPIAKVLVWVPFSLILIGISMGGMGVLGIYPVMFGYGFHF